MDEEQLRKQLADLGRGLVALGADEPGMLAGARALPSGTPTTNYMAGPGGIFGVDGLDDRVIHTIVQGTGIAAMLPAFGSNFTNPLVGYLTGVTDETGTVADGVCDDPEQAGLMKSCIGTSVFGRYSFESKELELNRLGQRSDRGEFDDLRLMNNPLVQILSPIMPNFPGDQQAILNDLAMAFTTLGLAFQRRLGRQSYTGNPVNNSAGGGYKEFRGLDLLIATGHVDAIEGTTCPSLDSDIKNFQYACIGPTESTNNDLVNAMTFMWRILNYNARSMGLEPSTWAITMRPDLFYEVTAIWPCSYLTYRCIVANASGERVNIDAGDAISMRDQMRQGSYLVIDGQRVPVIQDSFIEEETDADSANLNAGQFASDIYFVPLTAMGGTPVTFWEYFDYAGQNAALQAIREGQLGANYFTTDGGRYLWHNKPPNNWCVQWLAKIEPRIRMLTPHLAGRIQNVCYSPLQHTRDVLPDDGYFVDGGVSSGRPAPSYYDSGSLT